jgi:NhaP-type Na+/H+ or K+/H+ antiporter
VPPRDRRPLGEAVVLLFAVALVACLVAAVVGVVTVRLVHPTTDVTAPAEAIGTLLTAMFGYVLGSLRRRGGPE